MTSAFEDRNQWLPYDPPGWKRRQRCVSGRCWEVRWRDRLAWRIFCFIAHSDHSQAVWHDFRWTRKATSTEWKFGDEGSTSTHHVIPLDEFWDK